MIGSKYIISGMIMEVLEDEGEHWKCLNHTTSQTVRLKKTFLEQSIKLGKAEPVSDVE